MVLLRALSVAFMCLRMEAKYDIYRHICVAI